MTYDRMLLDRDTESRAMDNVRMFFGASFGAGHNPQLRDGWVLDIKVRAEQNGPGGRVWEALWNLLQMHLVKSGTKDPGNGSARDVRLFDRVGRLWAHAMPECQTGSHDWWEWEPVLLPQENIDRSNPSAEDIRWRARSVRAKATWNAKNNPVDAALPTLYPKWCCDATTGQSLV
jgi:hypothetical protein